MGIIDFCIIVIFAYYLVTGFEIGLSKQILSFANWLLALLLSFLLIKPFTRFLESSAIFSLINQKVTGFFAGWDAVFNIPFDYANPESQISHALGVLGLPRFIGDMVVRRIDINNLTPGLSLGEALASPVSGILLLISGFIFLFFVFLLIIRMIASIINDILSFSFFGVINRWGGALFSLGKAVILISVLMLLLSFFASLIPAVNRFLFRDMQLNKTGFALGRYFYCNNPLNRLINIILNRK
ncbi:MAG: CvpA family protein [Bacilli bacterium]|nr:CvpA family protein [Bacilli bacterium]